VSTSQPNHYQEPLRMNQLDGYSNYVPTFVPPVVPSISHADREIEELLREKFRDKATDRVEQVLAEEQPAALVSRSTSESNDSHFALNKSSVWGIDYHALDMAQTLDCLERIIVARKPSYAVTANLNYAMLCKQNPRLAEFTRGAALVLCDGMPILWRSKLNVQKLPARVAGSDLIYRLAERCAQKRFTLYLYGAATGVARKAADRLTELYPGLRIAGVQCPPFHASSSAEIQASLARIKLAKPDVLMVALGQPKGEYWIEDHLAELNVPLSIQLGASFDFVAGNAVRAPRIWQQTGMEWLYRTLRDPKRLGPRYLSNLLFLAKAIRRELIDKLS
jgi:N-acetylglucosaminyldiphosphoundecaprenol N-acetyl-beta-D-mannosaminyltransferase